MLTNALSSAMETKSVIEALIQHTHQDWHVLLRRACSKMDASYLQTLLNKQNWLPGSKCLFAAFSMPRTDLRYILVGESPYPRAESANGYAFWDASVASLWGKKGFSKEVNRATSLRNWLKCLLHARGDLQDDFSMEAIQKLNQSDYIQTAAQFFTRLMQHGFLLLNATLVYEEAAVKAHAKQWQAFMQVLLNELNQSNKIKLILFGNIAKTLTIPENMPTLRAEHPYNLSFITNPDVLAFFKPFDLLASS